MIHSYEKSEKNRKKQWKIERRRANDGDEHFVLTLLVSNPSGWHSGQHLLKSERESKLEE